MTNPNPIDVEVGRRIRVFRHARNITQQQLAEQTGCKFQQIQKYETGANRVSASRLAMIAEALESPIALFFEGQVPDVDPIDLRLAAGFKALGTQQKSALQGIIEAMLSAPEAAAA